MADDDIAGLVRFRAPLDDNDDALRRMRRRVTEQIEAPRAVEPSRPAARRRTWVLAASGAAASVVAILAVAATLSGAPDTPGTSVGSSPTVAANPLAPGPASEPWSTDLAATVDRLAGLAAQLQPVDVPDGKVVHLALTGYERGGDSYTQQLWYEPDGQIVLRNARTGARAFDMLSAPSEIAAARATLASEGPSIGLPTRAYLAGLPNDPAYLYTLLTPEPSDNEGKPLPEYYTVKAFSELFMYMQPVMTPQLRAALYRTLPLISGVRSLGSFTVNGRTVVGIAREVSVPQGTRVLFFDAGSGAMVGQGLSEDGEFTTVTLWDSITVEDAPAPGPEPVPGTKRTARPDSGPSPGGAESGG